MSGMIEKLKSFLHDRRVAQDKHVDIDRRKRKHTMKDADERLHESLDELDKTVRMKREDFFKSEAVMLKNLRRWR